MTHDYRGTIAVIDQCCGIKFLQICLCPCITSRLVLSAYRVWGKLNKDQSNAILYPTWYSGKHWDNDWLIGPGMGLDPSKYCIIVPNMFGNGLSSSPSNTPPPANAARFPEVSFTTHLRHCYSLLNVTHGSLTMHLSSRYHASYCVSSDIQSVKA